MSMSAACWSIGAFAFISFIKDVAASFPTSSAFFCFSPKVSAPMMMGCMKSNSKPSFECIAHNVMPEPVDAVCVYSVLICFGQLRFN